MEEREVAPWMEEERRPGRKRKGAPERRGIKPRIEEERARMEEERRH
jgi:hypothetical protein